MNYVISILVAILCVALGKVTLDINICNKIKLLKSKNDERSDAKSVSRKVMLILLIILFLTGFTCAFFVLRRVKNVINIIKMLVALLCLVGSACVDYREHRIPNLFPALMALSGIVLLALGHFTEQAGSTAYIVGSAMSAIGCVLFLSIASFLSKGGVGAGDIKLLGALGLLCGVYTICETLFVSMMSCAILSVILLGLKKKNLKSALPFGPFILLGFIVSVIFFSF